MTISTRVSSQTDFLIVSHADRTGPPNSPDLNSCEYFLWGFLKENTCSEKAANNNGIEDTNHSGLQRDN
jgi:hypothetical protein